MQILTRLNKVIAYSAHGYTPVGNSAICAVTGNCYDNALITTVDCVPTDIDCYNYYYINGKFVKEDDNSKIRETNNNDKMQMWVGTLAEYNKLTADQRKNLFAVITDDTTKEAIFTAIEGLNVDIANLGERAKELEVLSKLNASLISGNTDSINSQRTVLNGILRMLNQHTTGLQPTLNSERLLDGYGYYYVYAQTANLLDPAVEEVYAFGVVCYAPTQRKTRYYHITGGTYPDSMYKEIDSATAYCLSVSMEGELSIVKALGLADVTSDFEIYTGLIAGF